MIRFVADEPEKQHPLKQLRRAIHLTQKELADKLGCSLVLVKKIEQGKSPISNKLAKAIEYETGADSKEIQKGTSGKAIDKETGEHYTSDHYFNWKAPQIRQSISETNSQIKSLLLLVESLLHASRYSGDFLRVKNVIEDAVTDCATTLGLSELSQKIKETWESELKLEDSEFSKKFVLAHQAQGELVSAIAGWRNFFDNKMNPKPEAEFWRCLEKWGQELEKASPKKKFGKHES